MNLPICVLCATLVAQLSLGAPPGLADGPPETSTSRINLLFYDKAASGAHIEARARLRETLLSLSREHDFRLVVAREPSVFSTDTLALYDALLLAGDGDIVPAGEPEGALDRYLREGGGLVALYASSAYSDSSGLLHGLFGRPYLRTLAATEADVFLDSEASRHPEYGAITDELPPSAVLKERWLEFSGAPPGNESVVLVRTGNLSHRGETIQGQPLVWVREHEAGRIVYNALGKENVYEQADGYGRTLLWNSIRHAAGDVTDAEPTTVHRKLLPLAESTTLRSGDGRLQIALGTEGRHEIVVRDSRGRQLMSRVFQGPGTLQSDKLQGMLHVRIEHAAGRIDRLITIP